MMRLWLASAVLCGLAAPAAAEESPFLPPKERADGIEARIQQRIERAVTGLEDRLTRAVIDALDGKGREGALNKALEDAVARRLAGGGALPASAAGTGLPRLPPLPGQAGGDVVPAGATFVGCLDGRAFFQDRSGTPFLVDPRAFPASPGGPSSCAR